jgi:hypothetical protein
VFIKTIVISIYGHKKDMNPETDVQELNTWPTDRDCHPSLTRPLTITRTHDDSAPPASKNKKVSTRASRA